MIESILFLALSLGWLGVDQAKENKRKRKRQEEKRKNSSSFKFFWEK